MHPLNQPLFTSQVHLVLLLQLEGTAVWESTKAPCCQVKVSGTSKAPTCVLLKYGETLASHHHPL